MSLAEDARPSSRTSPSVCWKIRYRSRSDTAEIMPGTSDHQSPLVSPLCSILEPHRCECSVEEGEQTLDAALERVSDAVDAVDVGAGHDAVAHHDEVLCGVLWFATPR
jgi:hypothetical protein